MLNVSERSVDNARVVRDHGITTLQDMVAKGAVAPSTASNIARLPETEQQQIVQGSHITILFVYQLIAEHFQWPLSNVLRGNFESNTRPRAGYVINRRAWGQRKQPAGHRN